MVAFAYISSRRLEGRFMPSDHPAAARARQAGTTLGDVLRRSFRFGIRLGIVGGLLFALVKVLGARRSASDAVGATFAPVEEWPPLLPDRTPAHTAPATSLQADPEAPPPRAVPTVTAWVDPNGDVCPTSHPVKAKLSSKIFHLPGMLNYDRTKPDRCYRDGDAAEADGLRPAKR